MVWQEKARSIVMIANLKEGGKSKCEQYWPDSGTQDFGPFQVTITDQQILADYVIRKLTVKVCFKFTAIIINIDLHPVLSIQLSGSSMKVTHFHFIAWPDHGVPDYVTPLLTFHKRVMRVHDSSKGPMVIHCR